MTLEINFELVVGGEGKDTSRHLESIRAICEAPGQILKSELKETLK